MGDLAHSLTESDQLQDAALSCYVRCFSSLPNHLTEDGLSSFINTSVKLGSLWPGVEAL